jgi:hypothetical protein
MSSISLVSMLMVISKVYTRCFSMHGRKKTLHIGEQKVWWSVVEYRRILKKDLTMLPVPSRFFSLPPMPQD